MNSPALAQLVAGNPAIAALVEKGDYAGAAAAFNALTEDVAAPIPLWRVKLHLFAAGVWQTLPSRAADKQSAAALLDFYNDRRFDNLDPANPVVAGLLELAVKEGVATQEQVDELIALGTTATPVCRRVLGREADFGDFTPPANDGGQGQ